jgi:hypothetical protein
MVGGGSTDDAAIVRRSTPTRTVSLTRAVTRGCGFGDLAAATRRGQPVPEKAQT